MLETAKFEQVGSAVTTGLFSPDLFEHFLRHLCGRGDEPVCTLHWSGKRECTDPITYHYRSTATDVGLALARAGRFEPDDSLALLNVVRRGTSGLPSAADISAVRGHAVRLPFGPSWRADKDPNDRPSKPRELLNLVHRLARAGAEPIILVDPIDGAYWALWLLDRPDYTSGDSDRKTAYRAQARRLAAAVGGIAAEDPLTVALPMPGATDFRVHHPNRVCAASIAFLSFSEKFGREIPRYGTRFEDLDEMLARVEATPSIDLFAKENA